MTYSYKTVENNNQNIIMTAASASTKADCSTGEGRNGENGGKNHTPRRTPPITSSSSSSSLSSTVNKLAFDIRMSTNNENALHSNSMACSTNMQQHPLMSGSPSSNVIELGSTPDSGGSYFGSQRKQRYATQWQSQNNDHGSISSSSSGGGGGGAFFHKNNYCGQNLAYTKGGRRQQRDDQLQRTPSSNHSPATVLGGGGGGGSGSGGTASDSSEKTATSTGRKRRPKFHFQSPIISTPVDLGVGGNISPTHPLLPAVLTHFAGSKCFDAPAPSAVPKPPQHWMQSGGCLKNVKTISPAVIMGGGNNSNYERGHMHTLAGHVVKSSKRNLLDDFDTHNLKLLLNVQA